MGQRTRVYFAAAGLGSGVVLAAVWWSARLERWWHPALSFRVR
ncbi:MAG: hypothetical protein ACRCYU_07440 [Nocardioides sp.]